MLLFVSDDWTSVLVSDFDSIYKVRQYKQTCAVVEITGPQRVLEGVPRDPQQKGEQSIFDFIVKRHYV